MKNLRHRFFKTERNMELNTNKSALGEPFEQIAKDGFQQFPETTTRLYWFKLSLRYYSRLYRLTISLSIILTTFIVFILIQILKTNEVGNQVNLTKLTPNLTNKINHTETQSPKTISYTSKKTKNHRIVSKTILHNLNTLENTSIHTLKEDENIKLPLKKLVHDTPNFKRSKFLKEKYIYNFKIVCTEVPLISNVDNAITSGTPAQLEQKDKNINVTNDIFEPRNSKLLEQGLRLLNQNDIMNALTYFERGIDTKTKDINFIFYAGICSYRIGDYEQALRYLYDTKSMLITNFDEEADWYIAETLLKMNKKSEAISIYLTIYRDKSFYTDLATKRLKELKVNF